MSLDGGEGGSLDVDVETIDLTSLPNGSILKSKISSSGTFAKSDVPNTTVYTDQTNTFGAFLQKFQAGANLSLTDTADTTKIVQFSLSGLTTGTTRTLTVPDISDTLVTLSATQSLANKTLPSPVLSGTATGTYTLAGAPTISSTLSLTNSSPLSIANGQTLTVSTASQTVGASTITIPNFAGVSDTLSFVTLAQTLKNKDLDTSCSLVDASDVTKELSFSLSGMTTGAELTLSSSQSTTQTLTVPNITGADTLAVISLAQTLSNKTLASPILSGTTTGTYTLGGTPTISSTTAFTNSNPLSIANGQTLTLATTAQTVGGATLTIPNFASVNDTFAFITLAQTLSNKTLASPILSGTTTGTYTLGGTPTISSTTAFTNASPLSIANGQTLTLSTTSQTVGAATLTIPNFAGVSDTFSFTTLAQTLSNKTIASPILSGSATGTYTLAGTPTIGSALALTSTVSKYNNVSTTGLGVPAIYGYNRPANGQTGAVASVSTYTVGGSDGSFLVSANANVTTFVAGTFNTTVTYTDETNTSRTLTLNFSSLTGTVGIAIAAAGPFEGLTSHIRCKAGTTITIATSGTFTSLTYNIEGAITQIA